MELKMEQYRIGTRIGRSDQEVFEGCDTLTDQKVAIKMEVINTRNGSLTNEVSMYDMVHQLDIELMGPNLHDLFKFCSRQFTLKTVLMLADQLITRLESIHALSYIHRSVKPDNFVMGTGDYKSMCYMIDLATMERFEDPHSHRHYPMSSTGYEVGNVVWAPLSSHYRRSQCRRDDLESLGYMLAYFLRGSLPWQGMKFSTNGQLWRRTRERKQYVILLKGYKPEFQQYFNYVMSLQFEETPDYSYLRKLFRDLFEREGYTDDGKFDWTIIQEREAASQGQDTIPESC